MASYTISGGSGGGPLARTTSLRSNAVAPTGGAVPRLVRPATTTGNSTWTTYSPRFNVSYASYIPVDNIVGPTPCYSGDSGLPARGVLRYKGDANRGTYRATQAIFVVPDKQLSNNFFAATGATRNYGIGSPVNGSTLDSTPTTADIYDGPYTGADEDNTPYDCHLWNEKGHAETTQMQTHAVSFSGHQAVVTLSGSSLNPLEPKLGSIDWSASIKLDATDPSHPTASLDMTHTCYPAHIVKVNGMKISTDNDIPSHNNIAYISYCLVDPTGLSNTRTTTSAIGVPAY